MTRVLVFALLMWASPLIAAPIHEAAQVGDLAAVTELINQGADVDARNERGGTALHWAVLHGYSDVAQILIDNDAIIDARDEDEITPLHLAARTGRAQLVELLIDAGAEVDARDAHAITALGFAVMGEHAEVVALLIGRGADVNSKFDDMVTPLHVAVANGFTTLAELLLARGADVNAATESGQTPLDWVPERGHRTLRTMLEGRGGTRGGRAADPGTATTESPGVTLNFRPGVTGGFGVRTVDMPLAAMQSEVNAIARCKVSAPDVEIDWDMLNGYFMFEGPDARLVRECLVELEGWQALDALPYTPGTMRSLERSIYGAGFRSWVEPGTNLEQLGSYFVVTEAGEGVSVGSVIADVLDELGIDASSGAAEDMPVDIGAKITYEAALMGDTRGMDFLIFVHDPATNALKALIELERVPVPDLPIRDVVDSAVRYLVSASVRLEPRLPADLSRPYEARTRRFRGSIEPFVLRGDVDVINAQPFKVWPTTFPRRALYTTPEYVNYRQLVEVAKETLEEILQDAERDTGAGRSEKSISLAISDFSTIARYETFIHFTVETGDGYVGELRAQGEHGNYRRAIDLAAADMATKLLNDPNVIAYLEN